MRSAARGAGARWQLAPSSALKWPCKNQPGKQSGAEPCWVRDRLPPTGQPPCGRLGDREVLGSDRRGQALSWPCVGGRSTAGWAKAGRCGTGPQYQFMAARNDSGTSPRGEQIPEVSQLFSALSCCFSCKSIPIFPACLVLPPPPALGEQDPESDIPLGNANLDIPLHPLLCPERPPGCHLDALKVPGVSPPPSVRGRLRQPVSQPGEGAPCAPLALALPRARG